MPQQVFVIRDKKISVESYAELCRAFAEKTTTPHGVRNTIHIREASYYIGDNEELYFIKELAEKSYQDCGYDDAQLSKLLADIEECIQFEVWSWGANGNNPYPMSGYSNEADAIEHLQWCAEQDLHNACDAPAYFFCQNEAETYLKELEQE